MSPDAHKRFFEASRSEFWIWALPLVMLLLNLGFLLAYRGLYRGQALGLERRVASSEDQVAERQSFRRQREEFLGRIEDNAAHKQRLYEEVLATERQRVTQVIAEVKELARRAGMAPTAVQYPQESIAEFGLVKRSMIFQVEGNYSSLREFINLLELSDSFLTLEEVRLSSGGQGGSALLRIDLRVSTLFVDENPELASTSRRGRVRS